jgi:hypothetical protein
MSNTSKLNLAYLDFDTIKASLRDYLRSQAEFKDYNFEGSGLSVLLDVLAYNTHYFGFYFNMVANEMFLDSAALRSSVVSLAKQLNYTPRSVTSAQARVSLVITPTDGAASAVIARNSRFTTHVDGSNFTFVTDRAYGATIDATSGKFIFPDVTLVEGTPYTFRYVVDFGIPNQRFVLPSAKIDTSLLAVRVQNSITDSNSNTFVLSSNLLEIKSDSRVYFLQEVEDQKFEIIFGDGVIGQALLDGNVISVDYLISSGTAANAAATFTPATNLSGYAAHQTVVTTLVNAAGGLDAETTDSVRFSAPKNFEAQDRAVTVSDYTLLVSQDYSNADSVAVWGGEDNVPPQYGKVFVSIKPVDGYVVTETAKVLVVQEIIRKRNIVSVIPELVDPDYTFLIVTSKVKYNPSNTTKSDGDIRTGAYNAIVTYAKTDLDKFDLEFRYSRLLSAIDGSDTSITNNLSTIQVKKIFKPAPDVPTNYDFYFNNALVPSSVSSSVFIVTHDPKLLTPYRSGNTYTLTDDGLGTIQLIQHAIGVPDVVVRKCGTIDYTSGHITLAEFAPFQGDATGSISIIATPQENDIVPVRNNILFIKPEDIAVIVIPVTPSQG